MLLLNILIKIAVTVLVVTLLSMVADRAGPRLAGILAGYPAGSAISLFFIGLEIGPQFAGSSALFTVAGLAAQLCFLLTYYLVSDRLKGAGFWQAAALSTLAALGLFLLAAFSLNRLISGLQLSPWAGMLPTFLLIPLFHFLFRRILNTGIAKRAKMGPGVLLFRAGAAALVIVTVTGTAHLVGPDWAGLFTAFPATVFPLVLIVHYTYGPEQAHTLIKNIPVGMVALVVYALTVSFVYPLYGISAGTLLAFGAATLYLAGLAGFRQMKKAARTAA